MTNEREMQEMKDFFGDLFGNFFQDFPTTETEDEDFPAAVDDENEKIN